jgi:exodeoxyribonuclease VII large subunit
MSTLPLPFGAGPDAAAWTVSDLNRYVRQALEADYRLQDVRVRGEVSGFKAYPSGHWYFSLKDGAAQVDCVMWRSRAERQRYAPHDGDAVEASGAVTLYEARGKYQLDVSALQPQGAGLLYQEFVRLKDRLEREGLFDAGRKRPLPERPGRIGLVTSAAGAALRDILNILRRRHPLAAVLLAPTPVQGPDAPPKIVGALRQLAALPAGARPDVVIVARGGGALEDLWAFNDEAVARAIAAMPMPVVSGVGHETDFTIADFVADLRAPTPSAAAELVTRISVADLRAEVDALSGRSAAALTASLAAGRARLARGVTGLRAVSPEAQLRLARHRLAELGGRTRRAIGHTLALAREREGRLTRALQAVSPLAVLGRGYALVRRPSGAVIRRAVEVAAGEALKVRVSEGEFNVRVEDV